MDSYKSTYRRARFNSPGVYTGGGKKGERQINQTGPQSALKMLRSPSQYISSSLVVAPDSFRLWDDYQDYFAMERDVPFALRTINKSKLAGVVRKSLKRDNFEILGWRARKLEDASSSPVSPGLYRFDGVGSDQGEWVDWSIILKVIQSPANLGQVSLGDGENPTQWNYWKRELLVYQSGWLENLPEGISAPRCYEAVELPGNIAGLWLEDINDSFSGAWSLYRYALTARHLGRLNGTYITRRALPNYPWLSTQRTRQWLNAIAWKDFPWDHPKARRQFASPEMNSLHQMLENLPLYLARLDELPRTVSHGDTYPTNFKSRRSNHSQEQTVAMDWAYTGIEPLGDDLGQLVYGTHLALKGYRLQDISHALFTSYINGLEDSGCRVDPKWVRFGYVASAALRVGLYKLVLLRDAIDREDDLLTHPGSTSANNNTFETAMAEEASQLLEML